MTLTMNSVATDAKDTAVELLFLSEPDLIEAGVLEMDHCVEVIDKMFHVLGKGDYLMGGLTKIIMG